MSLDKAIQHGKERRKEYRGWKAYDPSCRNHGSDEWFVANRKYKYKKREAKLDSALEEYEDLYE